MSSDDEQVALCSIFFQTSVINTVMKLLYDASGGVGSPLPQTTSSWSKKWHLSPFPTQRNGRQTPDPLSRFRTPHVTFRRDRILCKMIKLGFFGGG